MHHQNGVLAVVRSAECQLELDGVEVCGGEIGVGCEGGIERRIVVAQLRQLGQVGDTLFEIGKPVEPALQLSESPHRGLGGRHVVPEIRIGRGGFELFDF